MTKTELEQKLRASFLNDARKRNRRLELTDPDGTRIVSVRVSGVTVGLAYALELQTGESDALARVIEDLPVTV